MVRDGVRPPAVDRRGLLRTSDAATLAPGVELAFYCFSGMYVVLATTTGWLLYKIGQGTA